MTARIYPKDTCKQCGKKASYVSQNHLCLECSMANLDANIKSMRDKEGPTYDMWKAAMKKAVDKL